MLTPFNPFPYLLTGTGVFGNLGHPLFPWGFYFTLYFLTPFALKKKNAPKRGTEPFTLGTLPFYGNPLRFGPTFNAPLWDLGPWGVPRNRFGPFFNRVFTPLPSLLLLTFPVSHFQPVSHFPPFLGIWGLGVPLQFFPHRGRPPGFPLGAFWGVGRPFYLSLGVF